MPGAVVEDASAQIAAVRMIKTEDEIDSMRQACDVTCLSLEWAFGQLREGITEHELAEQIAANIEQRNAIVMSPIVLYADHAAHPHGAAGDRKLKRGDLVLVDVGSRINGFGVIGWLKYLPYVVVDCRALSMPGRAGPRLPQRQQPAEAGDRTACHERLTYDG